MSTDKAQIVRLQDQNKKELYPITKSDQALYKRVDNTYGPITELIQKKVFIDEGIPTSAPNGSIGFKKTGIVPSVNMSKMFPYINADSTDVKIINSPNMQYCIIYGKNGAYLYKISDDNSEPLTFLITLSTRKVLSAVFNINTSKIAFIQMNGDLCLDLVVYTINQISKRVSIMCEKNITNIDNTNIIVQSIIFDKDDSILLLFKHNGYDGIVLSLTKDKYTVSRRVDLGYNGMVVDSYNKFSLLYDTNKILLIDKTDFSSETFLKLSGNMYTITFPSITHNVYGVSASRTIIGYQIIDCVLVYVTKNVKDANIWFTLCKHSIPLTDMAYTVTDEIIIEELSGLPTSFTEVPIYLSRNKKAIMCTSTLCMMWDVSYKDGNVISVDKNIRPFIKNNIPSYHAHQFLSNRYLLMYESNIPYLFDLESDNYFLSLKHADTVFDIMKSGYAQYFMMSDTFINSSPLQTHLISTSILESIHDISESIKSNPNFRFNNDVDKPLSLDIYNQNQGSYVSTLTLNTGIFKESITSYSIDAVNKRLLILGENDNKYIFDLVTGRCLVAAPNISGPFNYKQMDYVMGGKYILVNSGTSYVLQTANFGASTAPLIGKAFIELDMNDTVESHFVLYDGTVVENPSYYSPIWSNDNPRTCTVNTILHQSKYVDMVKVNINGVDMIAFHNGIDRKIHLINKYDTAQVFGSFFVDEITDAGMNTRTHTLFSNGGNIIGISATDYLSIFEINIVNGEIVANKTVKIDATTLPYFIKGILPSGRLLTEYKTQTAHDISTETLYYYIDKVLIGKPNSFYTISKIAKMICDDAFYKTASYHILNDEYSLVSSLQGHMIVTNECSDTTIKHDNRMIEQRTYNIIDSGAILSRPWLFNTFGHYIDIPVEKDQVNKYSTVRINPTSTLSASLLSKWGISNDLFRVDEVTYRIYAFAKIPYDGNLAELLYQIIILN